MKHVLMATVITMIVPPYALACDAHEPKKSEHAHHASVDSRGDQVMGFSHQKTKHNFVLLSDGGAIEVRANDAADHHSVEQIRAHLQKLARLFTKGEFSKPHAIHGKVPDGVETMKNAGARVQYRYEELERGARVSISASDAQVVEAVHAFMRFQIKDHRTGDPLEVRK